MTVIRNTIKRLKREYPQIKVLGYRMDELIAQHPALYMGLGGSFDIYGGDKKRAPKLFLNLELEWLYRLRKEPTRVSRQFAFIKFMLFIGKDYIIYKK